LENLMEDRQDQTLQPFLQVQAASKRFGPIQALADISFSVFPGEILGLIGPNGAGKTTLLECLSGLQPVTDGAVEYMNRSLPPQNRRQVMFYVPDGIVPYPEHTLERVLAFFGDSYGLSRSRVEEIVGLLELGPMRTRPVGQLSKGWRRRLLLAIGLITPHPLLIMDEPFDGFDLRQTRMVMRLLRDVASKGRTLFLSIHQLTDAEKICDRFVLLSAGKVRGEGTLDDLRRLAGTGAASLEEVFLALS
jgi:ABC-type multidrug transport system ATPase subunit